MALEAKHAWLVLLVGLGACRALDVVDVTATIIDGGGDEGGDAGGDADGDGAGDDGGILSYVDVVTVDTPLAWYRFTRDDAQGSPRKALDASGHGLDGLYGSAARSGAPGALRANADTAAYVIDAGTGSITLPAGAGVGASDFAIEAWVSLPTTAIDDFGAIYLDDSSVTHGFGFGIDASVHPTLRSLSGGASVISDATLTLGTWHHLVAVVSGGVGTLYVDGVVRGSGPFTPVLSGTPPSLGGLDVGAIDAFLDEVALYDHMLTPGRIAAHFETGRNDVSEAPCTLTASTARVVTGIGNILQDLSITATAGPALDIQNADGAIVRRVRITLDEGTAIRIVDADDVVLEDVEIIYTASPAPDTSVAIVVDGSARLTIERLRVRGASAGIELASSPRATLRYIEGLDFRGTGSAATLVTFGTASADGVLDGFSLGTSDGSVTQIGHGVSTRAANSIIRHGVLSGNVSPGGAGVMIVHTATTVEEAVVEDVEIVGVNDHCADLAPGITTTFRRVGCGPTLCQDQGRGAPTVGAGQGFRIDGASSEVRFKDSRYFTLCGAAVSGLNGVVENDLVAGSFPQRPPLQQTFCWDL